LIVDLLTPTKPDGKIDGRSLGRYLDHLMPHVQGFFLGGPYLGGGGGLSPDQYEELLEKTLVVVRGRVPVFIWFSRETEDQSSELLSRLEKRLVDKQYDGPIYWVDAPLLYHSNRGLPYLYRKYASLVRGNFFLHNDPELVKTVSGPLKRTNIRTSILKELGLNKRISGLIFSGTLDRSYNYQRAVREREDFRLYDGDEARFLNFPNRSGVVSQGANLAPATWARITGSSLQTDNRSGDYPDSLRQLWELGQFLEDLREAYVTYGSVVIRQVLNKKGYIEAMEETGGIDRSRDPVVKVMDLLERYEP